MNSKLFILLALFSIITFSCDKEPEEPDCPVPNTSIINTTSNTISFSIPVYVGAGFYEIEYGPLGFTLGTGTTLQEDAGSVIIENIPNGTYDLYIRSNCGGSDWSDWSDAASFLID